MASLNSVSNNLATNLGGVNGPNLTVNLKPVSAAAAKPAAADQARVSSTGGLVAQALNTSDVRAEKVTSLQSAIASGSYSVSASDVASKIVDALLK